MKSPFTHNSGTVVSASARPQRQAEPADAPMDVWDRLIEGFLIGLLAFATLALGAVQAWSEMVVLCLAAGLVGCCLVKLLVSDHRPAWSWCHVLVVAFPLLALVQMVALPAGLVRSASPNTPRLRAELLGEPLGGSELPQRATLSFYPSATRHDLALVLAAAAVFVTVSTTWRNATQVRRLLGAIAAIGGAVAALALAQHLTHADRIYWVIPTTPGGRADAGPFVNHSHFAQLMNLSIGAAVGLLLVNLRKLARDHQGASPLQMMAAGWRHDRRVRVAGLLCAMIVASLVAIALSMSRGGVVSALVAGGFTCALLTLAGRREERGGSRDGGGGGGSVLTLLGLAAFGALLYFGYDAVHERFAPQGELLAGADGGRLLMLKDLRTLWAMFPALGTGLGTHRFIFPMVDTSGLPNLAAHAENEYAQVLEETGAVGLAIVLAFIALVWVSFGRAVRGRRTVHASAFGLGFGFLAVLLHSFSDFGQHLPANACLTAAVCGLLVALPRIERHRHGQRAGAGNVAAAATSAMQATPGMQDASAARPRRWARPVTVGVAASLLLGLALMLPQADAARRAASHWAEAQRIEAALEANGGQGSDDDYSALIAEAAAAAALRPDDVEYAYGLNLYRWLSISRDNPADAGPVVLDAESVAHAARIVGELLAARSLCPTFGDPYTLAGQLEMAVLGLPEPAARHVRTGYRLAPQDPTAALVLGRLEATAGNGEASLHALRRAVGLDASLRPEAMGIYLDEVSRPDLALALAGDDPDLLFRLAEDLEKRQAGADIAAAARDRGLERLKVRCQSPDATAGDLATLATLCQDNGETEAAITYWRRALASQLGNGHWRLQLAKCLAAVGRTKAAVEEARLSLRAQPGNVDAERLIESLEGGER